VDGKFRPAGQSEKTGAISSVVLPEFNIKPEEVFPAG
jgi:hypothetical protein